MTERAGFLVAAILLASGFVWAARLFLSPDNLSNSSAALLALAVLGAVAVAALGIVLSHGQWARRFGYAVLAGQIALLVTMDFDGFGWVALVVTAAALLATTGPWLDRFLRQLPPADGPPAEAVLLALGLLVTPAADAVAAPAGLTAWHWSAAIATAVVAWSYSQAHVAGLWSARLAVPVVLLVAGLASPPGGLVLLLVVAAGLSALAWTGGAVRAVTPLQPQPADGVAVPPELVPADLLARAGYDERGRRIEKRNG